MTVAKCSMHVNSFSDRFPHYAWTEQSAHSGFVGSRVCACLGQLAICAFGRMTRVFYMPLRQNGVEMTPNMSPHKKLTLEKKILLLLLQGRELATFRSRVQRSTNKLSHLCLYIIHRILSVSLVCIYVLRALLSAP